MSTDSSINKKITTRSVRLSSQSFSDISNTPTVPINAVGTRYGKDIYPYRELIDGSNGFLAANISYKLRNPFKIFRESAKHLYLTNNSGISVAGTFNAGRDRGLFLKLNKDAYSETNISSIQMSLLWNNELFPTTDQRIFDVVSAEGTFEFYVKSISTDRKRAEITVKLKLDGTVVDTDRVIFYWNGKRVSRPVLTISEWGMLGITFNKYLSFNQQTGYLKITSPVVVNNISTYQLDPTIQAQQVVYRQWEDILESPDDEDSESELWNQWDELEWENLVYKTANVDPSIDPSEIYKVYIGTNKVIADSDGNSGVVRFNKYQYATYKNVQWDPYITGAV
jgi:hypothetical protein